MRTVSISFNTMADEKQIRRKIGSLGYKISSVVVDGTAKNANASVAQIAERARSTGLTIIDVAVAKDRTATVVWGDKEAYVSHHYHNTLADQHDQQVADAPEYAAGQLPPVLARTNRGVEFEIPREATPWVFGTGGDKAVNLPMPWNADGNVNATWRRHQEARHADAGPEPRFASYVQLTDV